jgi:hypothetical protein
MGESNVSTYQENYKVFTTRQRSIFHRVIRKDGYAVIEIPYTPKATKKTEYIKTLVSLVDLSEVLKHRWYVTDNGKGTYYISTFINDSGKRKKVYLQDLIMGCVNSTMVADHVFHDTLDNRREYLRVVTKKENSQNRAGANKGSTTGVRNVYYNEKFDYYYVQLFINKSCRRLGSHYKTLEEAAWWAAYYRSIYYPNSLEYRERVANIHFGLA